MDVKGKVLLQLFNKSKLRNGTNSLFEHVLEIFWISFDFIFRLDLIFYFELEIYFLFT